MDGMPPTMQFNRPLGKVPINEFAKRLRKAKKNSAKKSGKKAVAGGGSETSEKNTAFIPLTKGGSKAGSLPIRPGNMPRPVSRNSKGGKFTSNPEYGKWKKNTRTFKGNMSEQGFIQSQTSEDIGHVKFTNDLFPEQRIPGKQVRNTPYNRAGNSNISARQKEATRIQTTINAVNSRKSK